MITSTTFEILRDPIWRWGIPNPIFIGNLALIESMIREQKLKALAVEHLEPIQSAVMSIGTTVDRRPVKPVPFPGGIKQSHLHYKGSVYLLNDEQWKSFSSEVMKVIQDRLAKAHSVSFTQLLDVSDAVTQIN
jgi:hypothetical protein